MTTNTHERPEWLGYPELIVTNDPAIPEHVEDWLQRRYAPAALADATAADAAGITVNHEHARREHIAHLATEAAPGPPIAPKRRPINWWGIAATLAGIAIIVLSIVGTVAVLQQIAER